MSIAIVDDNPVNLIVIEKILKSAGYSSFWKAASAMELLDRLTEEAEELNGRTPVDLILMDMMMPGIDGIEACRRLQQDERLRDIPVIIVTALGDSNKLAEALEAGASDYVTKPVNKIELIARIRAALRLKYEKDWHKENEARIRRELELARQVQTSVLSLPVEREGLRIRAAYDPSFELAGDMYAWHRIDDRRYGVILLDMMGHGISSSLVCMFIASVLQDTITRFVSPEFVIAELNRHMNQLNGNKASVEYYFTAIYLVIDTDSRTIEYVNAGHPPGFLFEEGKPAARLEQGSCAVGFFDQMEIVKGTVAYERPIRIVLYTDGLQEAVLAQEDAGEEADETELWQALLTEALQPDTGLQRIVRTLQPDMGPHGIVRTLLPDKAPESQTDDICLVLIEAE